MPFTKTGINLERKNLGIIVEHRLLVPGLLSPRHNAVKRFTNAVKNLHKFL